MLLLLDRLENLEELHENVVGYTPNKGAVHDEGVNLADAWHRGFTVTPDEFAVRHPNVGVKFIFTQGYTRLFF